MVSPRGPMKRMAISPSESSHYSSASTRSPQGSNMQYVGEKCRMRLNYLKSVRLSEANTVKMLAILKGLAQCHVVLGLIMLILSTIADYTSGRINTIRLYGLEECCSFYFIVTGLVGMCGAASYRRGLVITFLVMSIHAIIIFVPTVIIVSSFDIHFFQHECWGECDWHLLAPRLPTDSRCQILCGEHVDDNMRMTMTRLGTDYRLDAGLITAAIIELGLAIASTVICTKTICGSGKENTFCPQKCSPKGAWPMPPYRPGRLGVASVGHKGSSNYGNGAIESRGSIRLCHRRSLKRDPPPPRPLLSSPPFDTGHYTSENNS